MFLQNWFPKQDGAPSTKLRTFLAEAGGSFTTIFGQQPKVFSHGVLLEAREGVIVAMAFFYTTAVFALAIVFMQYAGNLAAIQSEPTVVPVFDSISDLYGLDIQTSNFYKGNTNVKFTLVDPFLEIKTNEDIFRQVRLVDNGTIDAFIWDWLILLNALQEFQQDGEKVCVKALNKRIYSFEYGLGIAKNLTHMNRPIVEALQQSMNSLQLDATLQEDGTFQSTSYPSGKATSLRYILTRGGSGRGRSSMSGLNHAQNLAISAS